MDDGAFLAGVVVGVVLSYAVTVSFGAWVHEKMAADRACKDHGGFVIRTDADVVCKDRSQWHWREGYIVRMKEVSP